MFPFYVSIADSLDCVDLNAGEWPSDFSAYYYNCAGGCGDVLFDSPASSNSDSIVVEKEEQQQDEAQQQQQEEDDDGILLADDGDMQHHPKSPRSGGGTTNANSYYQRFLATSGSTLSPCRRRGRTACLTTANTVALSQQQLQQGRPQRQQQGGRLRQQQPQIVDPYQVLQVRKDATNSEIRYAYRRLSLWHHPGRKLKSSLKERSRRRQVFEVLAACYQTLVDKEARSRCDTLLKDLEEKQRLLLKQQQRHGGTSDPGDNNKNSDNSNSAALRRSRRRKRRLVGRIMPTTSSDGGSGGNNGGVDLLRMPSLTSVSTESSGSIDEEDDEEESTAGNSTGEEADREDDCEHVEVLCQHRHRHPRRHDDDGGEEDETISRLTVPTAVQTLTTSDAHFDDRAAAATAATTSMPPSCIPSHLEVPARDDGNNDDIESKFTLSNLETPQNMNKDSDAAAMAPPPPTLFPGHSHATYSQQQQQQQQRRVSFRSPSPPEVQKETAARTFPDDGQRLSEAANDDSAVLVDLSPKACGSIVPSSQQDHYEDSLRIITCGLVSPPTNVSLEDACTDIFLPTQDLQPVAGPKQHDSDDGVGTGMFSDTAFCGGGGHSESSDYDEVVGGGVKKKRNGSAKSGGTSNGSSCKQINADTSDSDNMHHIPSLMHSSSTTSHSGNGGNGRRAEFHYTEHDTNRLFGGPLQLLFRARRWRPFDDPFVVFGQVFHSDIDLSTDLPPRSSNGSCGTASSGTLPTTGAGGVGPSAWTGSCQQGADGTLVYTTTRTLQDRVLTRTEVIRICPETGKRQSSRVTVTSEQLSFDVPEGEKEPEPILASCSPFELCSFAAFLMAEEGEIARAAANERVEEDPKSQDECDEEVEEGKDPLDDTASTSNTSWSFCSGASWFTVCS